MATVTITFSQLTSHSASKTVNQPVSHQLPSSQSAGPLLFTPHMPLCHDWWFWWWPLFADQVLVLSSGVCPVGLIKLSCYIKPSKAEHCLLRFGLCFSLFNQTILRIWNNSVHMFDWLWHNQAYGRLMSVCQVASWEHLLVPEVLCFHLVFHFVLEQFWGGKVKRWTLFLSFIFKCEFVLASVQFTCGFKISLYRINVVYKLYSSCKVVHLSLKWHNKKKTSHS